jgi:hypothetical protein
MPATFIKFLRLDLPETRSQTKKRSIAVPSPRGRLETLGKRFKEFAGGKGPQGRANGRERVNVRMRAGLKHKLV